jgi:ribosomal protein S18 acetylase RimI-like enzyme
MITIRRADAAEADILTDIACRSEACWGYDSDFMEKFKAVYRVTGELITGSPTYVICEGDKVVGFYNISTDGTETSLEYLYISPESIGKGYGKALWKHMVYICREKGFKEIALVTSPQAKEFYIKMGAVFTGEVESLLKKGRMIPRLVYTVQQ